MKLIDSIVKYSDTLFPVNCDGGTNEITKANTDTANPAIATIILNVFHTVHDKHVLNLHVLILK